MRTPFTRWSTPLATVLALAWTTSCSKPSSDTAGAAASASAVAAASASAAPPASSAKAAEGSAWAGSYTAKVGPVAPPDDAKEKTWTNDPGTAAVGPGTIALSVSGSRGDAQGDIAGPLGDLKISGVFDGSERRAGLLPKDPKADTAMTGFMVLAASGGPPPSALKGTLRVSNRDARIVREATVELAKK